MKNMQNQCTINPADAQRKKHCIPRRSMVECGSGTRDRGKGSGETGDHPKIAKAILNCRVSQEKERPAVVERLAGRPGAEQKAGK